MRTLALEQRQDGLKIFRIALMSATAIAALMAIAALALVGTARAQDNTEKLEKMQTTGTEIDAFDHVPQSGDYADQLRKNLEAIKLPDGFNINLDAVVPDARHMSAAWRK